MDNLLYTGLFRSPVSWAKVNREISLAITKLHPAFYIHEQKGFLFDSSFPLPSVLREKVGIPTSPFDDICFIYPPTYANLKGNKKFAILTVESTALPDSWRDALNKYIDTIFVPSHFCRKALTNSGVKKKIIVAPFGVNRSLFTPRNATSSDLFQFLFVGTPHYRKGVLELIKAFKNVFGNKTDIKLYIKLTYKPDLHHLKPWEIGDVESLVEGINNITIDYRKMNDNEIAGLIATSDVIVQPSYSEGFGLSILEAMAMEKPVITTCWSGEYEFVNQNNALILDSIPFRSDNIQYGEKAEGAIMQKPSPRHLSELLEYSFTNYSDLSQIRKNARIKAEQFTWDNTAKTILSHIY